MKYLGIDYGTKRIGVAFSDDTGGFAFPHTTLENNSSAIDRIATIAREKNAGEIILGDTRGFGNAENKITPEIDAFKNSLEDKIKLPVSLAWEAWSSVEARRFNPEERTDDASAAAVILQRFLDGLRKRG